MGNKLNENTSNKFFKFLLDCISFNTPQAIIFNISAIFIFLAIIPTNYLAYSPLKCIFKGILLPTIFRDNCPTEGLFANYQCPTCGLTRAMSSLLHGDINSALEYNILVIPATLVMLFLLIFNIFKLKKSTVN